MMVPVRTATRIRALLALLREARLPLLAAAIAAFGAVVSEVGAAQIVGGNLLICLYPAATPLTSLRK